MQSPSTGMIFAVQRLDCAFRNLCSKLAAHTTGSARGLKTVGEVFGELEHRIGSSFDHASESRSHVPPAVPEPDRNGPIMLRGRRALEDLSSIYGDRIVFHGSADAIFKLEPRQMNWIDSGGRRYPDGEPAICADTRFDVPIFLALFKGRARCGYQINDDGTITYRAAIADEPESQMRYSGHVHVLDRKHFESGELPTPTGWPEPQTGPRTPELRATGEVEPFAIVEVSMADFEHPIESLGT